MKKILWLLALPLMLTACVAGLEDEVNGVEISLGHYGDLTAGFCGDSRTYIENGKLHWHEGDFLSVFYGNTLNKQYVFNGKTGDNSGTFSVTTSDDLSTGNAITRICALYPYNAATKMLDSGELIFNLPTMQKYSENSFGKDSNPMVAVTANTDEKYLEFKNLCGLIKISMYGNSTIKSISLSGNSGEKISGEAIVQATYGEEPILTMGDGATDSITLDCGEGVTLGTTKDTATEFWFAVPPTAFEKGFTIVATDVAGYSCVKSTNIAITIKRNCIHPMSVFEAVILSPEDDEIWYKSSDGEVVTPYATDVFGANIVSNTCVGGNGVIKFDGAVTSIGDWAFAKCSNLTAVVMPESVTKIGECAFVNCSNIANLRVPDNVVSIGDYAFYHCGGLVTLTIPARVESIGVDALFGCTGTLYINSRVVEHDNSGLFKDVEFSDIIIGDNVYYLGDMLFENCTSLTRFSIPRNVSSVGMGVFAGCSNLVAFYGEGATADHLSWISKAGKLIAVALSGLTSYVVPEGTLSIGGYVFYNAASLESITIPDSIVSMDESAFSGCTSLKKVYISDLSAWCRIGYTNASGNPLYNGATLYLNGKEVSELTIPSDIDVLKFAAFYGCHSITSVVVPDGVTKILKSAFSRCVNLQSVTVSDSVITIGTYAFYQCTSLTNIRLGNRVSAIGDYTFYQCTALADITIPEWIAMIGERSFYNCSSLTSVTIPETVASIGEYAFYECSSLKEVYCKPTIPPTGGLSMFSGIASSGRIYVPINSLRSYQTAENWSDFQLYLAGYDYENKKFIGTELFYTSTDGAIVTPYSVENLGANIVSNTYENGQGIMKFDATIIQIGAKAFNECATLKSIIIPDGVTSVGSSAFRNCTSLTSITIPDSVTKIGQYAFYGCTSLTEVYCKPTTPPTVGSYMFYDNASGRKIYVPTASLEAYKVAEYWSDYAGYIVGYNF